ncbi:MAG: ergothioneine biosynthesis protein EgtB [Burkholderiaceae bacterium]
MTDDLIRTYRDIRSRSRALIEPLSAEDCALQSMPDASPQKWHLAHTSWFWETFVLTPGLPGYRAFDPSFSYLFNSYYNSIGEQFPRPIRGLLSRPDLNTVLAYREHVDAGMLRWFDQGHHADTDLHALVLLGLNHEQQHQELQLTDLKHLLSLNPLRPVYGPALDRPAPGPAPMAWHGFEGGAVTVGHDGRGFAFDNEGPAHTQWLAPYEIAERLVTNGEYLAFIDAGGYQRPEFWLSEGFAALTEQGWQAPAYWQQRDGRWCRFGLDGEAPLREQEPVIHLSLYEADAYARFAGARLATEFEWEHAARQVPAQLPDLANTAWQWTSSSYAPYPGYQAAAGAVGEYNGKFMVNQYVLRGGSRLTPPGHSRITYRNFFPAATRWQLTGLRLARGPRRG